MPEFVYEGLDAGGRRTKGMVSADTRVLALQSLKDKGVIATSIKEKKLIGRPRNAPGLGGISIGHLAIFTRKFAQLSKTDIPITVALDILAEEEESSFVREALLHTLKRIGEGAGLGEAMAERPRVFGRLYISMVEAGLNSGTLDRVADNLATMYENESAMRKRMTGRLAYPAIVLILCFVLGFVLRAIGFIPPDTFAMLLAFWGVIAALVVLGRTGPGYRVYREIGFRLPWIGGLMRSINLGRFCRVFGLQYGAGIPVLEGLEVSKEILQDSTLERAIEQMRLNIASGMDLREAMLATGVFPKRITSMVGVGERAGGIDLMLEKLAEYYDLDIETNSSIMSTVVSVVVFLLVAITVAIIVIGAYRHYYVDIIGGLLNEM